MNQVKRTGADVIEMGGNGLGSVLLEDNELAYDVEDDCPITSQDDLYDILKEEHNWMSDENFDLIMMEMNPKDKRVAKKYKTMRSKKFNHHFVIRIPKIKYLCKKIVDDIKVYKKTLNIIREENKFLRYVSEMDWTFGGDKMLLNNAREHGWMKALAICNSWDFKEVKGERKVKRSDIGSRICHCGEKFDNRTDYLMHLDHKHNALIQQEAKMKSVVSPSNMYMDFNAVVEESGKKRKSALGIFEGSNVASFDFLK